MLIAVAPNRHAYGAEEGDDWRVVPGRSGNDRAIERDGRIKQVGIRADYAVTHLTNALDTRYTTDAHLVAYTLRQDGRPVAHQPRVNKTGGGLEFVRSLGFDVAIDCLFADIDNPRHCEWTDELLVEARAQDAQLLTAGVYYTAHGRRVVQPLTRSIPCPEAEGVLAAWLRELQRLGLHPDEGCQDWTRHFRLPHVKRRGVKSTFDPIVSLAWMRPIDPPAPAPLLGVRAKARGARSSGPPGELEGAALAEAFKLAGWLGHSLGRGKAAVRCPFASNHTIGRDFDSSTVLFGPTTTQPIGWVHCSHGHCANREQREFLDALPPEARKLLPRRDKPAPVTRKTVPVDEARQTLEKAFRKAPDGLSVVVAGCGTGKTEAAIVVAGERATRPTHARTQAAPGRPNIPRRGSHSRRTSSRSR